MTTAAQFRAMVRSIAPVGAVVRRCTPDGAALRAPGSAGDTAATIEVADAEHDALVRLRFGPITDTDYGTTFTIYTTDPWAELPEGAWVLPELDPAGQLLGWVRLAPLRPREDPLP